MDVSKLRDLEESVVVAVETASNVARLVSMGKERDETELRDLYDVYLKIIEHIRKGLATARMKKQESKTSAREAHLSMKEIDLERKKVQSILFRLERMKERLWMDTKEMDVS